MGRTACTEPQCLYKGYLYLYFYLRIDGLVKRAVLDLSLPIYCTLHKNCLLKHVTEGEIEGKIERREYEEEDMSNYLMTVRKRQDSGICKRKH